MTDTLKSDLNCVISALLEAGLGLKSTHVAAVEKAIAELDRLGAEVKKLVPSTEPVQAAGDAKQYGIFGNHTDRLTDYHVEVSLINSLVNEHLRHGLHDKDQLLARIDRAWLNVVQPEWVEVKNRLREIHSALIAPAETSDQGQRSQTPTKQGCKHSHAERDPEGGMRCMSCKVNLHKPKAAEKPKPVSLVETFDLVRKHNPLTGVEAAVREALAVADERFSTLDQARGV